MLCVYAAGLVDMGWLVEVRCAPHASYVLLSASSRRWQKSILCFRNHSTLGVLRRRKHHSFRGSGMGMCVYVLVWSLLACAHTHKHDLEGISLEEQQQHHVPRADSQTHALTSFRLENRVAVFQFGIVFLLTVFLAYLILRTHIIWVKLLLIFVWVLNF